MFSCCCIPGSVDGESSPVLDIDAILQDFVWQKFLQELNPVERWCAKRQRSKYTIEVPTNFFHLQQYEQDVKVRELSDNTKQGKEGECHKSCQVTTYKNDTDEKQSYKFRFEKTRKTSMGVTVQKGFTLGGKASFNLSLPSKVGGGLDMKFNISKTCTDLTEETVTFETTSDITVTERSKVSATVVLLEKEVSYDFRVRTKLSMPNDEAPAFVRRDGRLCYQYVMTRLDKVFADKNLTQVEILHEIKDETAPDGTPEKRKTYFVVIETRGIMEGVRLSDQEIELTTDSLGEDVQES